MDFENMNELQRRLHNAAIVIDTDGDEYGFAPLLRNAIEEIERLLPYEQVNGALDVMQARIDVVASEIKSAFGKSPVGCDGALLVSVDAYNKIVSAVTGGNSNEWTERNEPPRFCGSDETDC